MTPVPLGLYVHFPWCVRKCPYCDFNSHPLSGELRDDDYLAVLLDDLDGECQRFDGRPVRTVYFGGGTPSLFPPAAFRALTRRVPEAVEVTLEANPGTVEHGDFRGYRRAGVTRISLGAQSFDAAQLKRLGRIHSAAETRRAAAAVESAGFASFNIDLMYGLPGQTVAQAIADLAHAVRLEPPHISWYQLTIEPKTAFAQRPPAGLPDDDEASEIEEAGVDFLARHGYVRYEVSAFARDGHQCAHNLNYWTFGDYIGIGAGGHGKLTTPDGVIVRTAKAHQPRLYMRGAPTTANPVHPHELPGEFMMNALRLADGVDRGSFGTRTGLPDATIAGTIAELVDWGLMRADRLALTAFGYRHLDAVVARFLKRHRT
ncbi:MAG: radical SAM family heme chaperone HemW [Gammaproteobacteria bacterium]|nr:radical SAM family heme chaperone HemW [Gammaproteobacteria bacterium]